MQTPIVPQPIEAVSTVKVQVDVPEDMWREARAVAVREGMTAKQMVLDAIVAWLKQKQAA